jgi:hypothetical protein
MENFKASEFNRRQLHLMVDKITLFRDGGITLDDLVGSLKALYRVLELSNEGWSERFLSEWGTLEIARAVIMDRKEQGEPSEKKDVYLLNMVNEAVEDLDQLIREELGNVSS